MKRLEPVDPQQKSADAARARFAGMDARWNAVAHADAAADGKFYYAVKSTGVYCRPSCPARRPLRQNVRFFDSPGLAEEAGYRPCKKCLPNAPALSELRAGKVADVCRLIETAEQLPSLEALAKAAAMSKYHFHRVFTKVTGLTPKAYARGARAEQARKQLTAGGGVTDAIYGAGFNSNSRFYAESSKILGMTAGNFRRGGAGEKIRFAVGKCSLGSILVAASDKGVCAIFLGDEPDKLVEDLQDQFANAEIIGGDRSFETLVAKVVGLVEAPRTGLDLPLDVRGTAFQRRVWTALQEIPPGSTVTYSDLAKRVGMPRAARAIAGACASNTLAVAIPCHRVVRTGGGLAGFRWGVDRKRALLKLEKQKEGKPAKEFAGTRERMTADGRSLVRRSVQ